MTKRQKLIQLQGFADTCSNNYRYWCKRASEEKEDNTKADFLKYAYQELGKAFAYRDSIAVMK